MSTPAVFVALGVAGPTTKAYSFWIDGNDLVNYLDWHNVRIEKTLEPGENSRASFRIENIDGTLDMSDFWGTDWSGGTSGAAAFPLREVRLYDHTHQEPLFGGYVVGMRMGIQQANKSYIELDCVGYGWLLDATFTTVALTYLELEELTPCIMSVIGHAGLRGGIRVAEPPVFVEVDPTNGGMSNPGNALFWDVTIPAFTTLRAAIMMLINASGLQFGLWVDDFKRLVLLDNSNNSQGAGPVATFGTTTGAESLELVVDFAEYASNVYVDSATAAGRGWYQGRMIAFPDGTESAAQPQDASTYQPIAVDAYLSKDESIDEFTNHVVGQSEIAAHQHGLIPTYTVTDSGTFGWRIAHTTHVDYAQLRAGASSSLVIVTGLRMSFLRPDNPLFELRLVPIGQWGQGGYSTSLSSISSSAAFTKRRLALRQG